VLVTIGLGHGVYRKLYTLIGDQRAQKFENHYLKRYAMLFSLIFVRLRSRCCKCCLYWYVL